MPELAVNFGEIWGLSANFIAEPGNWLLVAISSPLFHIHNIFNSLIIYPVLLIKVFIMRCLLTEV